MRRPPPPLTFIRSFECAARHLSFTRAAEELGYTQAAISTHIRALEKYVGRALFVRKARSLQMTEMGEAFLPTLRQALAQIDSATEAITASAGDRSVIVACPMSLAENWMPACLADFHLAHPEIEVAVYGTVWGHADDRISDIVISVSRDDEAPPGAQQLWRETLLLLCAPALRDRLRAPAELAGLTKIVVSGRQEYWTEMAAVLGGIDLTQGRVIKTNASNVSLEMAAHGLGITVAPTTLSRIYLKRGLLVEPFYARRPSPWAYYIANRPRRSGAAGQLMAHLAAWGERRALGT